MNDALLMTYRDQILKFTPKVSSYIDQFRQINRCWRGAITAGMIETGRMEKDAARLYEDLSEDMRATITSYENIQNRLVNAILTEMLKKVVSEIFDEAKFTINILKRNLFERTADVGYLSTDGEIISFLKAAEKENCTETLTSQAQKLRSRLYEYQCEYTVYNDILILDLNGRVMVNLATDNTVSASKDALLEDTQVINLHNDLEENKYIETFRPTDLMPGRGNALIYSQKIEEPETRSVI